MTRIWGQFTIDEINKASQSHRIHAWHPIIMEDPGGRPQVIIIAEYESSAADAIPAGDPAAGTLLSEADPAGSMQPTSSVSPPPAPADTTPPADIRTPAQDFINCACCGGIMNAERELEKSTLYRCSGCGVSDTRLR